MARQVRLRNASARQAGVKSKAEGEKGPKSMMVTLMTKMTPKIRTGPSSS